MDNEYMDKTKLSNGQLMDAYNSCYAEYCRGRGYYYKVMEIRAALLARMEPEAGAIELELKPDEILCPFDAIVTLRTGCKINVPAPWWGRKLYEMLEHCTDDVKVTRTIPHHVAPSPKPTVHDAAGVLPWKPGDELPEDTIRRMRSGEDEWEERELHNEIMREGDTVHFLGGGSKLVGKHLYGKMSDIFCVSKVTRRVRKQPAPDTEEETVRKEKEFYGEFYEDDTLPDTSNEFVEIELGLKDRVILSDIIKDIDHCHNIHPSQVGMTVEELLSHCEETCRVIRYAMVYQASKTPSPAPDAPSSTGTNCPPEQTAIEKQARIARKALEILKPIVRCSNHYDVRECPPDCPSGIIYKALAEIAALDPAPQAPHNWRPSGFAETE